jgi:hypothetical protein
MDDVIRWRYSTHSSREDQVTGLSFTDKKENQIFLIYKDGAVAKSYIINGLLIKGNICAFPHILGSIGSPSSYMTLQLLHSEFP